LKKTAVAFYGCELVDKMTADYQPHSEVYQLLLDLLANLASASKLAPLVRDFEKKLLVNLGFGVPPQHQNQSGSLRDYIEEITERPIQSPKILNL